MGLIYLVTCNVNGKLYVGQTTKPANERWDEHKYCANVLIRAANGDPSINTECDYFKHLKTSTFYNAMAKHGTNNFTFEVIEEGIDGKDKLNNAEKYYVAEFDCQLPQGYNGTSGGDSKYNHTEESTQKMKDTKRVNVDNVRNACLRGLPNYLTYNEKLQTIIIQNHPLCKYRGFSVGTYGSLEGVRQAVIKFIADLERDGIQYTKEKKENDLLDYPGVKATTKGYKLEKYINGVKYRAGFESQKFTREQNKQRAKDYYDINIKPLT